MNKTILIGTNNKFSAKANKWLFVIMGLIFLLQGGLNVYSHSLPKSTLMFGVLQLIIGVSILFYGLVGFSKTSKFAEK